MNQEDATQAVIRWATSVPVLTRHLRTIAAEGAIGHDDQELTCTVADMLDPHRTGWWADVLKASGGSAEHADQVWRELGGITGIYAVDWDRVRDALLKTAGPSGG